MCYIGVITCDAMLTRVRSLLFAVEQALVTEDGHVVEGRNFTVTYTIYNVGNT